jgi:hypothetical protein
MRVAGDAEMLSGRIEMDDAYLGGERGGGKRRRGGPGEKPIVVAVETDDKGRPRRLRIRRIARLERARVKSLAKRIIAPGSTVVTDGLACFRGAADAGCAHISIATGSGRRAARHPAFRWVNTVLGNIKTANVGTTARSPTRTSSARWPSSSGVSTTASTSPRRSPPSARPPSPATAELEQNNTLGEFCRVRPNASR